MKKTKKSSYGLGWCALIALLPSLLFACGDQTPSNDEADVKPGCPGCACDERNPCGQALMCQGGHCVPFTCDSNAHCMAGERCFSGGCIPESCGDGIVQTNEACDDGNLMNADGCNVKCDVEPTTLLPDDGWSEPLSDQAKADYVFVDCFDESLTGSYAPGPPVYVRVCARGFYGVEETYLEELDIVHEIEASQPYLDAAGANVKLVVPRVDVVHGGPNETDPKGSPQYEALKTALHSHYTSSFPGECDVMIGYVNTITDDTPKKIGGFGWYPEWFTHVGLVSRGNVNFLPGQTTAHELGHIFGLRHTFEPNDDGCSDTGQDPNCYETSSGCAATCGEVTPPADNIMSYYFCDTPSIESLSACQSRRSRCFISHMFDRIAAAPTCTGQCCDGSIVDAGFQASSVACLFGVAWVCEGTGGALSTTYDDKVIWTQEQSACGAPTPSNGCAWALQCISNICAGDTACAEVNCKPQTDDSSWTLASSYVGCLGFACSHACSQCACNSDAGNGCAAACAACSSTSCSAQASACTADPKNTEAFPDPSYYANCGQAVCCLAECNGNQSCHKACELETKPGSWMLASQFVGCVAFACDQACKSGPDACDACANQNCSSQAQACQADYP